MCSRIQLDVRPMMSNWPGTGNTRLLLRRRHGRKLKELLRRILTVHHQVRDVSVEPVMPDRGTSPENAQSIPFCSVGL
jgi:hypothetical protein